MGSFKGDFKISRYISYIVKWRKCIGIHTKDWNTSQKRIEYREDKGLSNETRQKHG